MESSEFRVRIPVRRGLTVGSRVDGGGFVCGVSVCQEETGTGGRSDLINVRKLVRC